MWKLTIEDDEGATREVDLERDGYSVGRDASCDVCLPERNVSRQHARFERDDEGRWWLADLGALYGSFVNGFRVVERVALSPGDVVQVGDHWIGLVSEEMLAAAAAAAAAESEGAPPGGEHPSLPWGVRSEPDQFLVFGGPEDGSQVRLDAGPVLVGVGEGVTIHLPEGTVPAGVHALVRPLPEGRYELVRRGDALTMRVRMLPADRTLLDDGDVVVFEAPGEGELLAVQFCAARRVRRSMLTPQAELAERAGRGYALGQRLDPATLPDLEALRDELAKLPPWWRLEGESVWPRPDGYRSEPVRFTDLRSEMNFESVPPPPASSRPAAARAPASNPPAARSPSSQPPARTPSSHPPDGASERATDAPPPLEAGAPDDEPATPSDPSEPAPGRGPTPADAYPLPLERRWRGWALGLVAALALLGGAWALMREGDPTPPTADLAAGGPALVPTGAAGAANVAAGQAAGADGAAGPDGAAGLDGAGTAGLDGAGAPDPAASAPPSPSTSASAASSARLPPGANSAKRSPAETDAARRERCKYLGLTRCD